MVISFHTSQILIDSASMIFFFLILKLPQIPGQLRAIVKQIRSNSSICFSSNSAPNLQLKTNMFNLIFPRIFFQGIFLENHQIQVRCSLVNLQLHHQQFILQEALYFSKLNEINLILQQDSYNKST